jgi:hypothetical protein
MLLVVNFTMLLGSVLKEESFIYLTTAVPCGSHSVLFFHLLNGRHVGQVLFKKGCVEFTTNQIVSKKIKKVYINS